MSNDSVTPRHVVDDSDQFRTDDSENLDHDEAAALNEIASPQNEREDAVLAGVVHGNEIDPDSGDPAETFNVDVGVDVVGSCGHKIGEVVDVRDNYVVVEKGFFMPEDVYVPKSAIANVDPHHLHLNVSKESVDRAHWDVEPAEDDEPRQESAR